MIESFIDANGEVQIGSQSSYAAEQQVLTPINSGFIPKFKFTNEGGQVRAMDTTTFTISNQLEGSILSTARTNGNPAQSIDDLQPHTIVKAGGMELTIQSAVNAGLLRKTANGYEEVNQGNFNSASEETESVPAEVAFNPELSHPQIENAFESIAQTVGGYGNLDNLASVAVAGITSGNIDNAAKRLATSMGTEHATAVDFINQTYQLYENKAAAYITKNHGVDGQTVITWAANNLPQSERNSILQQVYLGQSQGLDRAVSKYTQAMKKR